ncbi:ketosynthase [Streptomyces piniterrae]|uniref:Ketosynthase n=1 Tax=Streptomyces piniterrae TaxID=2571125 RepID=A0A4U0NRX5_9ACTN|nr:ketosynthase [Streptomyces piniterrae]TJZ57349.1 ketosynthase [Streptomyces piniterrae]
MIDTRTERLLVSEALVVPSGVTAGDITVEPTEARRVPGFVESAFSPLVKAVIDRCLADVTGGAAFGDEGARTGIVLATLGGDATTADLGSRLLASGQVANPLLFFQSVPTTILGVIARDYGITGPTTCVALRGDLRSEALDLVDTILDDSMDQVLLLGIDLAAEDRALSAQAELTDGGPHAGASQVDAAVAFFVRRADSAPESAEVSVAPVADERLAAFGSLAGLAQLYFTVRTRRAAAASGTVAVDVGSALGERRLHLHLGEPR